MAKQTTPRVLPANHFLAESLEEEASRLPPSEKAKADILREAANLYRSLRTSRLVRAGRRKKTSAKPPCELSGKRLIGLIRERRSGSDLVVDGAFYHLQIYKHLGGIRILAARNNPEVVTFIPCYGGRFYVGNQVPGPRTLG